MSELKQPARPSDVIRAEIETLKFDKDAIQQQVDEARRKAAATGQFADPHWLTSAERAMRIKGTLIGRLQVELGEADRRERDNANRIQQVTFERAFMREARTMLSPDLYSAILRAASRSSDKAKTGDSPV